MAHSLEALEIIRGKIILPEDFDKRLAAEPKFEEQAAAYTTVSLSYLLHCLSGPKPAIKPHIAGISGQAHLECSVEPEVYKLIFGDYPRLIPDEPQISFNRTYGLDWAAQEIFEEVFGVTKPLFYSEISWPDYLGSILNKYIDCLRKNRIQSPNLSNIIHKRSYKEIIQQFGTKENFYLFLNSLNNRRGIQIIYGDQEEYAQYIRSLLPDVKSIGDSAIRIQSSIPLEKIRAVLPLGNYEKYLLT